MAFELSPHDIVGRIHGAVSVGIAIIDCGWLLAAILDPNIVVSLVHPAVVIEISRQASGANFFNFDSRGTFFLDRHINFITKHVGRIRRSLIIARI